MTAHPGDLSPDRYGRKQLPKHFISWSALEAGWLFALGIISTPITAILIGPEQLGKAALVYAIFGLVEGICCQGMQGAVVRAPSAHTHLTDSVHSVAMMASLVGMIILIACAVPISDLFRDRQLSLLLVIASLGLPLGAATVVMSGLLIRKLRVTTLALCGIVNKTAIFLTTLTAAVLGLGAFSIVAGCIAGNIATLAVLLSACPRRPALKVPSAGVRPVIRDSMQIALETLLSSGAIRVFSVMVGYLHGVTALGYFQVGQRIVDECAVLFQSFLLRYGVAYFAAHSRRRTAAREDLVSGSKVLAYVSVPVFAGLALCADNLVIAVFGQDWDPVASVLRYCAIGWILAFPFQLVFAATRAFGRLPLLTLQAFVSTTASLAMLIATYGHEPSMVGLAWAGRQLPIFAFALIALSSIFPGTVRDFVTALTRPAAASLFMVVAVLLTANELSPVWQLCISVAVGVSAYALAVFALDPALVRLLIMSVKRGAIGSNVRIR